MRSRGMMVEQSATIQDICKYLLPLIFQHAHAVSLASKGLLGKGVCVKNNAPYKLRADIVLWRHSVQTKQN